MPGPGTYTAPTQFIDPENHQDIDKTYPNVGGKVYVDNNNDRFGNPILPRKPRDLVPGPGEYQIEKALDPSIPYVTKGGYVSQAPPFDPTGNNEKGVPGPAFYNSALEPKKISFLFNAAEKWTT